jgi:hypothetical protein
MPRDLAFQALKLLSQYIVSNHKEIPEGVIFQKTSCMNPDDAELVGTVLAVADYIELDDKETAGTLREIEVLLEKIGNSKWVHGELTHLGFRAGTRYEERVDVAKDSEQGAEAVIDLVDEAAINATTRTPDN